MKLIAKMRVTLLVSILALVALPVSMVGAQPPPPMSLSGYVYVDGARADNGTLVEAKIGGVVVDSCTTITTAGEEKGFYALAFSDSGEVHLFVAGIEANESPIPYAMGWQPLDLHIGALPEVTVTIDAPDEVEEGSDFIARVKISEVEDFDSCDYYVTYDPAVIQVTDVTSGLIDGTEIPIDLWGFIPPGVQGTLRVIENLPGVTGVSGQGYLGEIHFDVVGTDCDTSELDLHDGTLTDIEANEIPATWVDDSVHVFAPGVPPTAAFSGWPTTGVAPLEVQFVDESSGDINSWDWDFGDGTTSHEQNPSNTYMYAGSYTVSLTVSGPGGEDTETKPDYITVSGPVTVMMDAPAEVLEGSDFIARVKISLVEDFDSCDYYLTYDPAVIEVTDVTSGLIDGTEIPIDAWGFIPADTQGTIRPIVNLPGVTGVTGQGYLAEIHFDVVGTAGDTSDLDLHDGTLNDIGANVIPATWVDDSVHVFGVTVTMDAPDEVLEGSDFTATVNISEVVDFDSCDYYVTYDPAVIEVTDVSNGLIDGTEIPINMWGFIPADTQGTIRVIENLPGVTGVSGEGYLAEIHFDVVGTAGDTSDLDLHDGTLTNIEANVIPATWVDDSVQVVSIIADFTGSPRRGVAPLTVQFSDESQSTGDIVSWLWDFGDGSASEEQNPTHTYRRAGSYDVSLTATDEFGLSDTETKTDYITVLKKEEVVPIVPPGAAKFVASNLHISPEQVLPNEQVEISINIGNKGGVKGTHTVALYIRGYLVQSQAVGVSPGSSKSVVFRVNANTESLGGVYVGPETYKVNVEGMEGQFFVLARPPEAVAGIGGPLGTAGIIAIVVVVIVLVCGLVFGLRRE